jgi:hypothetical protein
LASRQRLLGNDLDDGLGDALNVSRLQSLWGHPGFVGMRKLQFAMIFFHVHHADFKDL